MATTIQLKIKDESGNIKVENHEIEEIVLDQYIGMMKVLNDALKTVNGDQGLAQLLDFFNSKADEESAQQRDIRFAYAVVGSFDALAVRLPEHAVQLVSVLSGISLDALKSQKLGVIFDIYDAIITENDIEKLMSRAKKSLALTKTRVKIKGLINKLAPAPKEETEEQTQA
ncbi:hypothetical protein [Sporolactobacillus terrae]|uniref:hypothetical protein n=1 Tax=Sporolactobacillus terrae TaxID=269673 RepID=UPI00048BE7CA|nr:hypothetical protein [Sporolactobacillus terrae]